MVLSIYNLRLLRDWGRKTTKFKPCLGNLGTQAKPVSNLKRDRDVAQGKGSLLQLISEAEIVAEQEKKKGKETSGQAQVQTPVSPLELCPELLSLASQTTPVHSYLLSEFTAC